MYILIKGHKGSYDRPIELSIIGKYETETEASQRLMEYIPNYEEDIQLAIQEKKEYYDNGWSYLSFGYNKDGELTYYSTGCPADNEYDGDTYQIFKIGE